MLRHTVCVCVCVCVWEQQTWVNYNEKISIKLQ